MTRPRLGAVATAVPRYVLDQREVSERFRRAFAVRAGHIERLMPVFLNAGIQTRYSCVPIEWYARDHDWPDRNRAYLEAALDLLERATTIALDRAALSPDDIDAVVVVSTTGIATPSLDALLAERMKLKRTIRRLPIFGLGCAGGVIGLARAATLAAMDPGANVLFLVVELCTLSFRRDDLSKSNVVATALFGDGAAAAILSCNGDGPEIGASGEYTWPKSLGIMGWDVKADGMRAIFSHDIPALVTTRFKSALDDFLGRNERRADELSEYLCHPGGAKVLDALETAFGIGSGDLLHSRAVLREYGNMSAATVMFVLERAFETLPAARSTLMTALGPGFTAAFLLLEPAR